MITFINISGLDPDAKAFLDATAITDVTITRAINTLVIDLKGFGVWSKCRAIYPMVGGTATTHMYNLKDPQNTNAAFRITWSGGITHSANGVQGNGVNGYGNTNINTSTVFNQNSIAGFYRVNATGTSGADFGCFIGGVNRGFQNNHFATNQMLSRSNNTNLGTSASTNVTGFYGHSRSLSSSYNHFQNGTKTTINEATTSTINLNIHLLGILTSPGGVVALTDRRFGSFYFSEGLSTGEQDNLFTADTTFQTILGR